MPSLPALRPVARCLGAALALIPSLARGDEPVKPVPAAPEVFPRGLTLDGPRDSRRVLVSGVLADGSAAVRRLTAEQLSDAIDLAAGRKPRFPDVPSGFRANQLPDSRVASGGFLDLFGRPARESPCECERSSEVSLGQALNLVNGPTISDALVDPDGRIARLLKKPIADEAIADEIYLAALSRFPHPDEKARAVDYLAQSSSKIEGAQDLLWALINSPAFLFNR